MREKFSLFLLVLGAFAFFASCSDSNPVATDSENITNKTQPVMKLPLAERSPVVFSQINTVNLVY